jgi:acyl transferase domain-containing protein
MLLKPEGESSIDKAEISQPLCTAVQVALVNLLQKWGVLPAAVVGHSSGEIAAAYAAGAFTSEIAIRIAYYRGCVAKSLKHGSMAAIGLGRKEVEDLLTPGVRIACENSGSSVTISGDDDIVESTIAKIRIRSPDLLTRKLRVEIAYHSRKFSSAFCRVLFLTLFA